MRGQAHRHRQGQRRQAARGEERGVKALDDGLFEDRVELLCVMCTEYPFSRDPKIATTYRRPFAGPLLVCPVGEFSAHTNAFSACLIKHMITPPECAQSSRAYVVSRSAPSRGRHASCFVCTYGSRGIDIHPPRGLTSARVTFSRRRAEGAGLRRAAVRFSAGE